MVEVAGFEPGSDIHARVPADSGLGHQCFAALVRARLWARRCSTGSSLA